MLNRFMSDFISAVRRRSIRDQRRPAALLNGSRIASQTQALEERLCLTQTVPQFFGTTYTAAFDPAAGTLDIQLLGNDSHFSVANDGNTFVLPELFDEFGIELPGDDILQATDVTTGIDGSVDAMMVSAITITGVVGPDDMFFDSLIGAAVPGTVTLTVFGVAGDDEIYVNNDQFDSVLDGGAGDDIIIALENSTVIGGTGNDTLTGAKTVLGGAGDDTLAGSGLLDGGAGNDTIDGRNYTVTVGGIPVSGSAFLGGTGNDTINGGGGPDSINGEEGDDLIYGNAGNDQIDGGDDDDVIYGELGDDILDGGNGDDLVDGDAGMDVVFGGDGDDSLYGGDGDDLIRGQLGEDNLSGDDSGCIQSGNDTLYGGAGSDGLQGMWGNDFLDGGSIFTIDGFDGDNDKDTIFGHSEYCDEEAAESGVRLNNVGGALVDSLFLEPPIGVNVSLTPGIGIGWDPVGAVFLETAPDVAFVNVWDDSYHWIDTSFNGYYDYYSGYTDDVYVDEYGDPYLDGGVSGENGFGSGFYSSGGGYNPHNTSPSFAMGFPAIGDLEGILNGVASELVSENSWEQVTPLGTPESDLPQGLYSLEPSSGGFYRIDSSLGASVLINHAFVSVNLSTTYVVPGDIDANGKIEVTNALLTIYEGYVSSDTGALLVISGAIQGDASFTTSANYTDHDTIQGRGGADTLYGNGGDDVIAGHRIIGSDDAGGLLDADVISGGTGHDTVRGNGGPDFINGDAGNDSLSGGTGKDTLVGGEGNDTLDGGDDDDLLSGDEDFVNGLPDVVPGNDVLNGGNGDDTLNSGGLSDVLDGGAGTDVSDDSFSDGEDTLINMENDLVGVWGDENSGGETPNPGTTESSGAEDPELAGDTSESEDPYGAGETSESEDESETAGSSEAEDPYGTEESSGNEASDTDDGVTSEIDDSLESAMDDIYGV